MADAIDTSAILKGLEVNLSRVGRVVERGETSSVAEVGDGIARIPGLKNAMSGELLQFTNSRTDQDVYGLVQNLDSEYVSAVLFGDVGAINNHSESFRSS